MKNNLLIFLISLFSISLFSQSGLVVQVGAFAEAVPLSYFEGQEGVYLFKDHNAIYHYYINAKDMPDAQRIQSNATTAGFNAYVINLTEIQQQCSLTCGVTPQSLRSIFFDFDQSFLRTASKSELDKLYQILSANSSYTTELRAHTDFKGSNAYNDALSIRRAESAKQYLMQRGITSSRIRTSTYGEVDPIAKNALENGADTEEGRQLNRRVELVVFDGNNNQLNGMVEEIQVPDYLEANKN